jgi:hypothetical protein
MREPYDASSHLPQKMGTSKKRKRKKNFNEAQKCNGDRAASREPHSVFDHKAPLFLMIDLSRKHVLWFHQSNF